MFARNIALSLSLLLLLSGAVTSQEAPPPPPSQGTEELPGLEQVTALRAATVKAIGEIAAGATEESLAGALRTTLERRLAFITEHEQLIAATEKTAAVRAGLTERMEKAKAAIAAMDGKETPPVPKNPTQEGLAEISSRLRAVRERGTSIRAAMDEGRKRRDALTQDLSDASEKEQEATSRLAELASATESASAEELTLRQERQLTARVALQAAQRRSTYLPIEQKLHLDQEPVLALEQQLAELELEQLEPEFAAYSTAIEKQLANERARRESELAGLDQQAQEAAGPAETFTAKWEAVVLRSQINVSALDALLVSQERDLNEHEKRLVAEREELANLRDLMKSSGGSGVAADRIKDLFGQLPRRHKQLKELTQTGQFAALNEQRGRRFQVEDMLFDVGDRIRVEREQVIAMLPKAEGELFRKSTRDLPEGVRTALRDERNRLTEAILQGQQLQAGFLARSEVLGNLDAFVRSKIYWILDAKPIGLEAMRQLPDELAKVRQWGRDARAPAEREQLSALMTEPGNIFYTALLLILPILLYLIRRRLRRTVREANQRTLNAENETVAAQTRSPLRLVAIGALSASLLPIYCYLASMLVAAALPHALVTPPLVATLEQIAVFLLGWFLSRSLFSPSGTATAQLGMHQGVARTVHRVLRILLLGWLVWLLPWRMLRVPPLELELLPRLFYVAFLITLNVCMVYLLRGSSPFARSAITASRGSVIARYWPILSTLGILLPSSIVIAELTGYSYGARTMLRSYGLSMVTILALPLLYRLVSGIAAAGAARQRHALTRAAPGGEALTEEGRDALRAARAESEREAQNAQQSLARFIRLLFQIAGVVLLAGYWGLDSHAFDALREIDLYSFQTASDEPQVVSAADLLRAVMILAGTALLLKSLPGILRVLLATRADIDDGARYAIKTISGYILFAVGTVMALSAVHLDLGRLGWLVAAMGVGLGFGLQEIVSNFVSGLILLGERPIRVGDVVTVGTHSGTVLRINIRATTLRNFDHQQVIVPNRSLVTGDVINWTRGDTIHRLVVPIGVAYGSDVDEVTRILEGICRDAPEVLSEPAPSVPFVGHGASSLDFELRVFVPTVAERIAALDHLNKEINRRLTAAGIAIPFPQQEVHIRRSTRPSKAPVDEGTSL